MIEGAEGMVWEAIGFAFTAQITLVGVVIWAVRVSTSAALRLDTLEKSDERRGATERSILRTLAHIDKHLALTRQASGVDFGHVTPTDPPERP